MFAIFSPDLNFPQFLSSPIFHWKRPRFFDLTFIFVMFHEVPRYLVLYFLMTKGAIVFNVIILRFTYKKKNLTAFFLVKRECKTNLIRLRSC